MWRAGKYVAILLAVVHLWGLQSCKEPDGDTSSCLGEYPIDVFLERYANDIIIPDYRSFVTKIGELKSAVQDFTLMPDKSGLDGVRGKFASAYLGWQNVEPYQFGPAEDSYLYDHLNNFPLNVGALKTRIIQENYDFGSPDSYDKGFPALDYLFYGLDTNDQALIDSFAANPKYAAYVVAMTSFMAEKTQTVLDAWVSSFKSEFTSNTGVAAGLPFSQIVNSLNRHFERIRRNRIGIPSGALTLNFPQPDEVEAPFSGLSRQLAMQSIKASRRFFEGADGEGLDNVLEFVQAKKDGKPLQELILGEYDNAQVAVETIPETLAGSAENNTKKLLDAYQILSAMVIPLKSDMPSVMCIAITYVDNPSDSD